MSEPSRSKESSAENNLAVAAGRCGFGPCPLQWWGAKVSFFIPGTFSVWQVSSISSIRESSVKIKPRIYHPTSSSVNVNSKNCGTSHTCDQVLGPYLLAMWLRSNYWRALSSGVLTCQMGRIMPSTVCVWASGEMMSKMCPSRPSFQGRDSMHTVPVLFPHGPSILVATPRLLGLFSPGLGAPWGA